MNQPAAEMYGRLNGNVSAFPLAVPMGAEKVHLGLTKREHIAILFMAARMAELAREPDPCEPDVKLFARLADSAVRAAESLLTRLSQ